MLISEREVLVECAIISEEVGSYFQPQRSGMGCGGEALELSLRIHRFSALRGKRKGRAIFQAMRCFAKAKSGSK